MAVAGFGVFVAVPGVRLGVSVGRGVFGVDDGLGVFVAGGVVFASVGTEVGEAFFVGWLGAE